MIERLFRGGIVAEKAYYKKFAPAIEWEWMLVVGIFIGAFLSAAFSGQFHVAWVPESGLPLGGCPVVDGWPHGGIVMGTSPLGRRLYEWPRHQRDPSVSRK
jgi:hypothetical protein